MANDLEKLQGAWRVTSLESDGQAMAEVVFAGATIVIKGSRFTSSGMGATYQGTVELDATSRPRAFDLLFTAGHAKGERNLGIYKLSGDRWTICLATRGDARPKKFATAPDSGYALETLARGAATNKPGKAPSAKRIPQPKTSGSAPPTELEGEWQMVAAVFNGAAMPAAMMKWARRTTRGNLTRVDAGPQVMLNATFTLDRSTKPNRIDYVNLEGANKGKKQAGIFQLSARDLKICMAKPGGPRPDEFSSKPGDGRSFTTWRLLKK